MGSREGFLQRTHFTTKEIPLLNLSMIILEANYCFLTLFSFMLSPYHDSSVQFSHALMSNSLWPHELQHTRPPSSWGLLKLMPIESVMPSSHLILCRPLLLLPPIPPSVRVFSNESTLCMKWPKYWSFSFSISPSSEHWGLVCPSPLGWTGWISLQSKGLSRVFSNTTVQKHQFFGARLSSQSNTHIHTWSLEKTIALTRQTFVGKVMSLLFNCCLGWS